MAKVEKKQVMNSKMNFFVVGFCLLVLSGCMTVGPDYVAPALPSAESWQQAKRYHDEFSSEHPDNLSQWWQQLSDPTLSDLINRALLASPDMKSAQAKLRESRARLGAANANLLPTVTANGTASRSKSSTESGSGMAREVYNAGFDASWEIDLFGGTRRTIEATTADYQATEANLQDVQVSLAAEVARNYANYRNSQSRLLITRNNLDCQSETLQITIWRAQAGLVSSLDVEQARTNREQTRAQIPLLETSLTEAEHRLAVLLGQQPGTLDDSLATTTAAMTVPAKLAVGIPADLLRQRPDVRAAERKLAAETARVGSATAALYPSFRLSGSLGLEALTLQGLSGSGADTNSLLASLTAPVFNGGQLRQALNIQTAVQEQTLLSYQKTVLTALEDVENALVLLANSQERTSALSNAAESARNAALLARHQYSAGLIDFLTVLGTERTRLSVEDSLAGAHNDGITSVISLYKALGGGWTAAPSSALTTGLPEITGEHL